MKKLRNQHILARDFLRGWRHLAVGAEFAGMHPEQLEAKVREAEKIRGEIASALARLSALRLQRDQTERALAKDLIRLANGVRGHPDYGDDSPFYSALGFIPHSEIRSGRPRKPRR